MAMAGLVNERVETQAIGEEYQCRTIHGQQRTARRVFRIQFSSYFFVSFLVIVPKCVMGSQWFASLCSIQGLSAAVNSSLNTNLDGWRRKIWNTRIRTLYRLLNWWFEEFISEKFNNHWCEEYLTFCRIKHCQDIRENKRSHKRGRNIFPLAFSFLLSAAFIPLHSLGEELAGRSLPQTPKSRVDFLFLASSLFFISVCGRTGGWNPELASPYTPSHSTFPLPRPAYSYYTLSTTFFHLPFPSTHQHQLPLSRKNEK